MISKLWQGLMSLRRGDNEPPWEFDERRELVRLRCHLEVSYTVGSKTYFGQIVDMSLGGMMLRCLQPPALASMTDVTYETPTHEVPEATVRCRVQWCKPRSKDFVYLIGLSYFSSEDVLRRCWVKVMLKELGFKPERIFQRRKFVRVNCLVRVRLATAAGHSVEGRLYNLGAKGALMEAVMPVDKGELVDLAIGPHEGLERFELKGRVVSCQPAQREYMLGVQFEGLNSRGNGRLGGYLRCLLEEGGGV